MTTNAVSHQGNIRQNRISLLSRIAKYICFVFFAFAVGYLLLSFLTSPRDFRISPGYALFVLMLRIILCFWYWKFAQLFQCYEGGLIFDLRVTRYIISLGLLRVTGWTVGLLTHLFPQPSFDIPSGPNITVQKGLTTRMGFFSFDFGTGIDFGPLLAGATIILIAWIMDEGRKITEEQKLTV
jgi:hypothetical protein